MIKYGLMMGLIIGSSLAAMQVCKDLKNLSITEIQQRLRENQRKQEEFNKSYMPNAWRYNDNIKKERDAIWNEGNALRTALLMRTPRTLIKPHGAIHKSSGESDKQKLSHKRSHNTHEDDNQVLSNQSAHQTITSDSNNTTGNTPSFDEIFKASIVAPDPKKIKTMDPDDIYERIDYLEGEYIDLLYTPITEDEEQLAKIAERSAAVKTKLNTLYEAQSTLPLTAKRKN